MGKITLPRDDVSRIVYVGLGVVCLHLAVLWFVQVGAQQMAAVPPTFSVQLPPLQLSTSPTPPATVPRLPSRKTTPIPDKVRRVAPKPQAPAQATPDDRPMVAIADSAVTAAGPPSSPTATDIAAPAKSDTKAFRTNPSTDSAASSLRLPSSAAEYLNNPAPVYPAISQRLGEQGKVMIRVLITKDGSPRQGEIHQSSGHERLDQAALRAVMNWHYVPGQRAGVPQDMWFNVPINFALK